MRSTVGPNSNFCKRVLDTAVHTQRISLEKEQFAAVMMYLEE